MNNRNDFLRALTIKERYEILDKNLNTEKTDYIELEKWRSRKGLLKEESYTQILEEEGFQENIFSQAIKETSFYSDVCYNEIQKKVEDSDLVDLFKIIETEEENYIPEYSMGYLTRPLIHMFENEFKNKFQSINLIGDKNKIWKELIGSLQTKLIQMSLKVFVLEINLFKENHEIIGSNEKERYHFIISELGKINNLSKLYKKYIVLSRMLCECVDMFLKFVTEVFENLDENWKEISEKFDLNRYKVCDIKLDMGDTHQNGKTVLILYFGNNKKIVYKPKNLEIAHAYNKLIDYINRKSGLLDLPHVIVNTYKDWCVEEFIEHKSCKNKDEIKRYYFRLGESTAIMHMLRGNDFHMENIVACGEYPYFIDIETLMNNVIEPDCRNESLKLASKCMGNDVNNTSLFPSQNYMFEKGIGIDLSGMNGDAQETPINILQPVNLNTDNIRFEYRKATIPAANNLPYLEGKVESCYSYMDEFIEAFKKTCEFFLHNKTEILEQIYPEFKGKYVRILVRNTRNYANVIEALKHPRYLTDFLEREKVLENTWAFAIKNKSICHSECSDMKNNDIPVFFTQADTRDLKDSEGKVYKNYFSDSSYQLIINKLRALNENEIERQIQIIKMYTGLEDKVDEQPLVTIKELGGSNLLKKEKFIKEVEKIADEIWESAIIGDDDTVCWVHLPYKSDNKLQIIDGSLYNGLSGMTLFYYYLYKVTGKKKYEECYKKILNSTKKMIYSLPDNSGITGKMSLVYVLSKIMEDDEDSQNKEDMDSLIKYIGETLDNVTTVDWISGYAGMLHIMLQIYSETLEEKDAKLCFKLADKIKDAVENNEVIYGGFAHGASGIALSMVESAKILQYESYNKVAQRLLEIDREYYNQDAEEWISIDVETQKKEVRNHWCHGTVGIGLSRLKIGKFYQDEKVGNELKKIMLKLQMCEVNKNQILCHGNMGLCDFFLEMYNHNKDTGLLAKIYKLAEYALKRYRIQHDTYNVRNSIGLFNGLAGIGYELLRICEPDMVPSILVLG